MMPSPVFRAEAAKVLGNIGTQSPAVLPELLRLLQKDADGRVRTEAARALGKIGEGAASASRSIAAVLGDPHGGEALRGAAAWALARVDPLSAGTASSLDAAADAPGHALRRPRRRDKGGQPIQPVGRGPSRRQLPHDLSYFLPSS